MQKNTQINGERSVYLLRWLMIHGWLFLAHSFHRIPVWIPHTMHTQILDSPFYASISQYIRSFARILWLSFEKILINYSNIPFAGTFSQSVRRRIRIEIATSVPVARHVQLGFIFNSNASDGFTLTFLNSLCIWFVQSSVCVDDFLTPREGCQHHSQLYSILLAGKNR